METQIHLLEQEAYGAVLRAFKAQSDALTWEKEDLITELRKELRVSDDEHRELLTKVNADDIIHKIREWRKAVGNHGAMLSTSQTGRDLLPSPTISVSRKRQKPSQSVPLEFSMQSPAFHPRSMAVATQPLSSASKWGPVMGPGGRKPKPFHSTGPNAATPRTQLASYTSLGTRLTNEPAEAATCDPLIGRQVMTRWPADNNFYEAYIADYNSEQDRYILIYDRGTLKESWELVDLKEIPSEDIRWVGEDPGISFQGGHSGQGHLFNNRLSHGAIPNAGMVRSTKDQSERNVAPSQNGSMKRSSDDIEIRHTDTLLKEVEKVFHLSHDLLEIEKAKKMLQEHEQALIGVIAKLADASDSESDGERATLGGQPLQFSGDQHGRPDYSGIVQAQVLDDQQDEYIDDI